MRKKKMLQQMRDMLILNNRLEQRLSSLESEIGVLRAHADELEKQVEEAHAAQPVMPAPSVETLTAEDVFPSEESADAVTAAEELLMGSVSESSFAASLPSQPEVPTEMPLPQPQPEYKAKPTPIMTDDGTIDVAALAKLPVNKEMQYATEAIGEVVIACATACNDFAERGGSAARELINLALGRTEVFKADCLTIATSNNTFAVKKECIDRIRTDTEDYFKGLKAQHFE